MAESWHALPVQAAPTTFMFRSKTSVSNGTTLTKLPPWSCIDREAASASHTFEDSTREKSIKRWNASILTNFFNSSAVADCGISM